MASYLPVISTKVGGIPDLVKKENGILIEPGDAKNLALALEKLINDKNLRESMGRNNREKIEKTFNIEIMLNKIINLYNNLILKEHP